MAERKLTYATVEIEVSFWEEDDPPLTQSEVEDLAHDRSLWADWRVLRVSQKRGGPLSRRGHAYRGTDG
jgi:hypothetical protein